MIGISNQTFLHVAKSAPFEISLLRRSPSLVTYAF